MHVRPFCSSAALVFYPRRMSAHGTFVLVGLTIEGVFCAPAELRCHVLGSPGDPTQWGAAAYRHTRTAQSGLMPNLPKLPHPVCVCQCACQVVGSVEQKVQGRLGFALLAR